MNIEKILLPKIYTEMWHKFKISLKDAEYYLSIIIEENNFEYDLKSEGDIDDFLRTVIEQYLFPCGFDRRSIYDMEELIKQKLTLKEVGKIPDGWDCKLYYDSSHDLYWEDHFGRYSIEGLRLSPYMDPIKKYKISK